MKPAYFDKMIAQGLTLASVESITGGLFAWHLTQHAHASCFYQGGLVVYNNHVKSVFARIDEALLAKYSAISKEVALLLAKHTLEDLDCDLAVSFVGNAGPSAQDQQPVGRCYIALVSKNTEEVIEVDLKGTRNEIQQQLVSLADQHIDRWLR